MPKVRWRYPPFASLSLVDVDGMPESAPAEIVAVATADASTAPVVAIPDSSARKHASLRNPAS
jgi:hypothetical protein